MSTDPVAPAMEHWRAGRKVQARAILRRLLQRNPDHAAANQFLAITFAEEGALDQALYFIDRAARAAPDSPHIQLTRGLLGANTPDWQSAAAALRRAVELKPDFAEAWRALGGLLCSRGLQEQAEAPLRRALELGHATDDVVGNLARSLIDTARPDQAAALLRGRPAPLPPALLALLAHTLNYLDTDPDQQLTAHTTCARALSPAPPPPPSPSPPHPLRIGYLSPDLRAHSIISFLEPILAHHDSAAFEVFAYHTGGAEDDTSHRLRRLVPHFRTVFPPKPAAIRDAIAADRIDILVDLAGLTSSPQLAALALRAAPVQVHFIGYPNSVGVVDARLVDALTDPPGADRWSIERLVRLPGCFLCYRPPADAPDIPADPCSPATAAPITFGSFNNSAKLSDRCLDLWSRILHATPASRLLLKAADLGDPTVRDRIHARLASRGIDPSRVECLSQFKDRREHLAAYHRVDIGLDTVPYNGTTTTCEALWMGTPVITLLGDRHAARVGATLLTTAGLPDLIAQTPDDFLRIATTLAADPQRRTYLRHHLRAALESSPLRDEPGHTRGVEAAYRTLWEDWSAGRLTSSPLPAPRD